MSLADDLYRETILDHYHHPRNRGVIDDATAVVEGINPLCGDELTLYLQVENGKIKDVKLNAKGCSINTASGSMMSEVVMGQSLEQASKTVETFKEMMLEKRKEEVTLPEGMEDLEALQGVKKYPVRIKCVLLPWNSLVQAIKDINTDALGVDGAHVHSKVEMN
jgi:nitrogen fixation protein NifU and related proteins